MRTHNGALAWRQRNVQQSRGPFSASGRHTAAQQATRQHPWDHGHGLAFASLLSAFSGPSERAERNWHASEQRSRKLFHSITQGKSRLTERDVRLFARSHGLPEEYAKPFFASLQKSANVAETKGIPFTVFHRFVKSREEALHRTFNTLDANKDGQITRDEMRIGLTHLMIKCPNSRCCYRTCPECVEPAVAAMARQDDNVTFDRFRKFFLLLPPDKMVVEYWLRAGDPSCVDLRCSSAFSDAQRKPNASPWGHLLAGAMAGAMSRTATAPIETMRLMAMTGSSKSGGSALAAATALVRQHGWRALYRGNGINVARSAPQKALDFFAFDAFKQRMARPPSIRGGGTSSSGASNSAAPTAATRGPALRMRPQRCRVSAAPTGEQLQLGPMATLSAAGMAGAVSTVVLHPLEVLRTRLSTDSSAACRSMPDALQSIARKEGMPALYRGIVPSVAAILPEAAITYGLFDLLKRGYSRWSGIDKPGVGVSLTAGVAAAFTGQVVAYPLETVSRRMQVSSGAASNNCLRAAAALLAEGGMPALYRGLGAASLRIVPMAIVSFGTYELVRSQVTRLEEQAQMMAARKEHDRLPHAQLACLEKA